MKSIKNKIPELLIYSRLALAWMMLAIGLLNPLWAKTAIIIILITGLLTDVFDGIIARHLKLSTAHLRQLDTKIDRIFWLSALFVLMLIHPSYLNTG
ncbi:MAG: CDP-alcohol phosphatidyltransferase family protein [Bacteroidota bacterium]|nr:CDP-alcohol phosphatidyltransferase family protein [Bacteroidota bacterium]